MRIKEYIEILERYYNIPSPVVKSMIDNAEIIEKELDGFEADAVKKVVEDYCLDIDPKFYPKLGYVVAKIKRDVIVKKDIDEFIRMWNTVVYVGCKSSDEFAKVKMAEEEDVKDIILDTKEELKKLIKIVEERLDNKEKPFLPIMYPIENIWEFGFNMLLKRRFYSDFLYNGCNITPRFFCGHIKEIADPYSDAYLNESEKFYHS